jgi:hypothetical protein
MNTFHEYTVACTKEQYEEYGQLESLLAMRRISSTGIHIESGFRGADGTIYYHMLLVMSPGPLENLHELFPGIHTQWHHEERQREGAPRGKFTSVEMKGGKLYARTQDPTLKGISFRI